MKVLCMIWLAQLLDLNPIENFYCTIKIQIYSYCHQIYSIKKMSIVINEK